MIRLTEKQIQQQLSFIDNYIDAENAASGSSVDSNANVTHKNITTMSAEINKSANLQINRALMKRHMNRIFGTEIGEKYIDDLESHLIYTHDETSLAPYCVSLNIYPFLLNGMSGLGNQSGSDAPKHLRSFCGSFVNLIQYVASQFAGAVATPEMLMYFDHFARKDFGDNYLETHGDVIDQELQGMIYLLNQDSSARGGQSVFFNISTFDEGFFTGMFGDFVFPDMSKPKWETLDKLQKHFHKWFRIERTKKLLTFPVMTHAAIIDKEAGTWASQDSQHFVAEEMSKGGEFFIYTSETSDSLSSCCRLRNEIADNTFSSSMGAGGVATGSKNVITINMNRLVQEGHDLEEVVRRIHKYQYAFHEHFQEWQRKELLPVYSAGYITLDKQYLTIGINGMVEAAEYLGYEISNNESYKTWLATTLKKMNNLNKEAKAKYGQMYNIEVVPAENLGVKNAMWDKADGLSVNRDCYNSYFYKVEDTDIGTFDKMELQGGEIIASADGGSAYHWNNDERCSFDQYMIFLDKLVVTGCNYVCENVLKTSCTDCGHIHANPTSSCISCGSEEGLQYASRVIGYLKLIGNYSAARQLEAKIRAYAKYKAEQEA